MFLNGCATLKDSLILGATSGAAIGAVAGSNTPGDHSENTIKGAILGGVLGGVTSYLIHGSLEKRDERVRNQTLMNLEHYDVLGIPQTNINSSNLQDGKCRTTQTVDGKLVSIPCYLINNSGTK